MRIKKFIFSTKQQQAVGSKNFPGNQKIKIINVQRPHFSIVGSINARSCYKN
ncbi:hypothetical protein DOY81_014469 [Sarcophaga bullata]|nr:hypothetical protein DOY81_014469 [Sarcophaga bullata]